MVRDDVPIVGREWTRQARIAATVWWITAWFAVAFLQTPHETGIDHIIVAVAGALGYPAYELAKRPFGELTLHELPDAPEGRPSRLGPLQRTLLALLVVVPPVGVLLPGAMPDWFSEISASALTVVAICASLATLRALHCRWSESRNGDQIVRVEFGDDSWLAWRPATAEARSEAEAAFGR